MDIIRAKTSLRAEFRAGPVAGRGKIRNLSQGGLFVGTVAIPEQGETVRVRFAAPNGDRIEATGIVWWTTDRLDLRTRQGFGVRLLAASLGYDELVTNLCG